MALNPAQKITFFFIDATGKRGSSSMWQVTDVSTNPVTQTGPTAVAAALQNLSSAMMVTVLSNTEERAVASSPTSSVWDPRTKLVIQLLNSIGAYRLYKFPNPKTTCFISPALQTMSTASGTPSLALRTALLANMVDENGGVYTFVRGYRLRSRHLRAGSNRYA
jgi:hypothetical protein